MYYGYGPRDDEVSKVGIHGRFSSYLTPARCLSVPIAKTVPETSEQLCCSTKDEGGDLLTNGEQDLLLYRYSGLR